MISSTPTAPTEESEYDSKNKGNYSNRFLTDFPPQKFIAFFRVLNFSHNPISSLRTLPTLPTLEEIILDNTDIRTFEGARPQPSLSSISLIGAPVCKCSFLSMMCVSTFGNSVKEVNGRILSETEISAGINSRAKIAPHMRLGWLVYSYKPLCIVNSCSGEKLNLSSDLPTKDAPAIETNECRVALPDIVDLPAFKLPTRADVCDTPTSAAFAFTDESNQDFGNTTSRDLVIKEKPFNYNNEDSTDTFIDAVNKRSSSAGKEKTHNKHKSQTRRKSEEKERKKSKEANKKKEDAKEDKESSDERDVKTEDFEKEMTAEKLSPLPKRKKERFVSPEPARVVAKIPKRDPSKYTAFALEEPKAQNKSESSSSNEEKDAGNQQKEGVRIKKRRRVKKHKKAEIKDQQRSYLQPSDAESDSDDFNFSEDEEESSNVKGFVSKRRLLQSDFESDSAYGTSLSTSDTEPQHSSMDENSVKGAEKAEVKTTKRRKKHHHHRRHHRHHSVSKVINKDKKKVYEEEVPVLIRDFGTIHIEPAEPEPKKIKKKKERKSSISEEPEIPVTPFLDLPKRVKKRKRLRKKTIPSADNKDDNSRAQNGEFFETDDYDDDNEAYNFKKMTYYDLIEIQPKSNNEHFSPDDSASKEEEEIIGPEEIIAELRKRGRDEFYKLRTVDTSTLEEMDRFVSRYVREMLKNIDY